MPARQPANRGGVARSRHGDQGAPGSGDDGAAVRRPDDGEPGAIRLRARDDHRVDGRDRATRRAGGDAARARDHRGLVRRGDRLDALRGQAGRADARRRYAGLPARREPGPDGSVPEERHVSRDPRLRVLRRADERARPLHRAAPVLTARLLRRRPFTATPAPQTPAPQTPAPQTKVRTSVEVAPRAKRSIESGSMSTVLARPSTISSAMSWPAIGPCMKP